MHCNLNEWVDLVHHTFRLLGFIIGTLSAKWRRDNTRLERNYLVTRDLPSGVHAECRCSIHPSKFVMNVGIVHEMNTRTKVLKSRRKRMEESPGVSKSQFEWFYMEEIHKIPVISPEKAWIGKTNRVEFAPELVLIITRVVENQVDGIKVNSILSSMWMLFTWALCSYIEPNILY